MMDATICYRVLCVFAIEQDRAIPPRMIVQCPVVIAAKKNMQIEIAKPVFGDQVPSQQVGIIQAADNLIRRSAMDDALPPRHDKSPTHSFEAPTAR
ncbi:hypothetical protein Atc_2092 [Acidithiobacillus caldus SM-1]|uniref:Uncharacterized protein n=1 Tax=Acidithiobacillus caldus (strain SM-1) TaxID=990288 RepID=F9ZR46_ACICS|nr:hypothetical protein Atc_2092 [Acidithiobacillus caldus SM-1]